MMTKESRNKSIQCPNGSNIIPIIAKAGCTVVFYLQIILYSVLSSFPKAFPEPSTFFVGLSELVFAT